MANIIEQIRDEHKNMAKLLDALDRQIAVFNGGGKPDYEIVVGVIDYFLDYPDRCHHPKEDLLARKILEDAKEPTGPLQNLEAQHEELGILTRRFSQLVHRVLDEAELPRRDFIRAATEFIASHRHHMEMEEENFLPRAETALSRDDLAALDSDLFAETDPFMDPDTEARYATLRNAILSWEAEAHG
jgi:hemerythrin-like domain-containing protein